MLDRHPSSYLRWHDPTLIRVLYNIFPAAQRLSSVGRDPHPAGLRSAARGARGPGRALSGTGLPTFRGPGWLHDLPAMRTSAPRASDANL